MAVHGRGRMVMAHLPATRQRRRRSTRDGALRQAEAAARQRQQQQDRGGGSWQRRLPSLASLNGRGPGKAHVSSGQAERQSAAWRRQMSCSCTAVVQARRMYREQGRMQPRRALRASELQWGAGLGRTVAACSNLHAVTEPYETHAQRTLHPRGACWGGGWAGVEQQEGAGYIYRTCDLFTMAGTLGSLKLGPTRHARCLCPIGLQRLAESATCTGRMCRLHGVPQCIHLHPTYLVCCWSTCCLPAVSLS